MRKHQNQGMLRYGLLLVMMALATGCGDEWARIFEPMPVGAIRFTPDTFHLRMWREVEACSGLRGSMRDVEWYFYPGTETLPNRPGRPALYRRVGHDVFFADSAANMAWPWRNDPQTFRHESLHALNGEDGHPPTWGERCSVELVGAWRDS